MAEDRLKNGHPELPEWCWEVLAERPIYSCRAHIATSFVLVVKVTGREVFRGDLEILGE